MLKSLVAVLAANECDRANEVTDDNMEVLHTYTVPSIGPFLVLWILAPAL